MIFSHGDPFMRSREPPDRDAIEHLPQGVQEIKESRRCRAEDRLPGPAEEAAVPPGAGKNVAPDFLPLLQDLGRVLVPLVLQQPLNQLRPRVLPRVVLSSIAVSSGEETSATSLRERCRHHQELAGEIKVQRTHQVDVLEVLLGNERDRNVEDVDLVFLMR